MTTGIIFITGIIACLVWPENKDAIILATWLAVVGQFLWMIVAPAIGARRYRREADQILRSYHGYCSPDPLARRNARFGATILGRPWEMN